MKEEEEEQCKRNREAFKRFFEHIPRTALIGVLSYLLHDRLSVYETDPSKPFSTALAYASAAYIFFQVAHAFARATHPPPCFFFDFLSLLCGLAVVCIAFAAFFHI
ncbi:uncharacterized protein LOC17900382 [Capsella rubella]|nr:uncharacterized protein LOC17900382 [Capsella rubella]